MKTSVVLGCAPALAAAFDFGFLAVAAPRIGGELGADALYSWLFSAASLTYGAAVMPASCLAQRTSPALVLTGGLGAAAAGAGILAAAGGGATALAGRALFGLGGGAAAAQALCLLGALPSGHGQRGAFSLLGAGIALGFSSGVVVAALAGDEWRAVLSAMAFSLAVLAVTAGLRSPSASTRATTSPTGALLVAGATVAAAACLAGVAVAPWPAAGVVLGAAVVGARSWTRLLSPPVVIGVAGAATTASGVGATVVLGRWTAAPGGVSDLVLGAFGLAALPAAVVAQRLSGRYGAAGSAARGLAAQATALLAIAAVLSLPATTAALLAAIAAFGVGHVVANAGVAGAIAGPAAPRAEHLVTAQYLGAGAGPPLVVGVATSLGDPAGMLAAAVVAALGATVVARLSG